MRYLRCMEYKKLGCHARAVLPMKGNVDDLQVNGPHNHPPDFSAEEKILFIRELRDIVCKNNVQSLKAVYDMLSPMYPNAAKEMTFETLRQRLNRWRRLTEQKMR